MGVDIQTYRGRIGTFKSSFGLDVVTIQCLVNFSHALKTIGRCIFIGLLLLMAGIESNPGPIDKEILDDLPATKTVLVSGLPEDIDIDYVEFLLNKTCGKVSSVTPHAENSDSIIVKFEDIKSVKNILTDEEVKITKKSVEVTPVYMNVIRIRGLDLCQEIESSREFLKFLERESDDEKVESLSLYKQDNCLHVIFKNEAGAKRLVEKSPLSFQKYSLNVQYLHDKDIHSVVHSSTDPNLEASNETDEAKQIEDRSKRFRNYLRKCGLEDRYNNKITIPDVVAVNFEEERKEKPEDLPWFLLRNLIHVNRDARDKTDVTNDSSDLTEMYNDDNNKTDSVSPLDIFHVVFQCCDAMLQQLLFQKLYLCKLAVPFIYINDIGSPVTAVWPLRSLKVQCLQKNIKGDFSITETEVLNLETNVVTFARVGRPNFSKSKLLNVLLSENDNNVFFNQDCNSGTVPHVLSNGSIEMFWLPRVEGKENKFDSMVTFLNCRGDIRDFSCNVGEYVSHISDCLVLIADIKTICQDKADFENILERFTDQRVILIIVDPTINYKEHLIRMNNEWEKKKIRIVSTHSSTAVKNVLAIVSDLSLKLKSQLNPVKTSPLECRIQNAEQIKTDEADKDCQNAKVDAEKMFSLLNISDDKQSLEEIITPVQYFYSKEMGNNMKKFLRAKKGRDRQKCIKDILEVRHKQLEHVSKFVQAFCFCISNQKYSNLRMFYFLGWLKLILETKIQNLPSKKALTCKNILESFKLEHIFREIGYIYDSLIALNKRHTEYHLPSPEDVSMAVSNLLVYGYPLELIEGESFYLPSDWVRCLLASVSKLTGKRKLLSISVLGVQSSGKSTLLNTMLGSQFSASVGRCTRGINLQCIPVCSELQSSKGKFDFVLIFDTEGLKAPEIYNGKYEHDNELATVITGIGDITVINIMGENSIEINEILQVVVRAFLRLKMANNNIDIRKCCYFVHQNVIDSTSRVKKEDGFRKLTQLLDIATKEAAVGEDIAGLETFNQIIEFDMTSNVWYFPNLWQGNIPMAHVNKEYSKRVCALRMDLLKKACEMHYYKSISNIATQITELWEGVLTEDLLFRFRSNLDFTAYVYLSEEVKQLELGLENKIYKTNLRLCQKKFSESNADMFYEVLTDIRTELTKEMTDNKIEIFDKLRNIFKTCEYRDIIFVWEDATLEKFEMFCQELLHRIQLEAFKIYESKKEDLLIEEVENNIMQELVQTSKMMARRPDVYSDEDVKRKFLEIWERSSKQVMSKLFTKKDVSLRETFMNCLFDLFRDNSSVLKAHIKNLEPLSETLKDTFNDSCINGKNDIRNTKVFSNVIKAFKPSDKLKSEPFEDHVKQFFENIDMLLEQYCKVEMEIAEQTVKQFLKEVNERILKFKSEHASKFSCDKTFSVKIFVHATRRAIFLFEKQNETFMKEKKSRFENHKEQFEIFFESYFKDRKLEAGLADDVRNVMTEIIHAMVKSNLPLSVRAVLNNSYLPKNLVIDEVLKDLVQRDNFDCFKEYINSPNMYIEKWLNLKTESKVHDGHLENSDLYYKEACSLTVCYLKNLKSAISASSVENVDAWIADVKKKINFTTIAVQGLKAVLSKNDVDLRCLKNNILESLPDIRDRIKMRFAHKSKDQVQWQGINPIKEFVEKARGCLEQCPYCAEPCSLNHDHTCKHLCLRHKPRGCRGIKQQGDKRFVLSNCSLDILSQKKHICDIFGFKCNKEGEQKRCRQEFHLYSHYKKYFPKWDIRSTPDLEETTKVWQWFIANYKNELSSAYEMIVDNVPQSWFELTSRDVLKSLENQQ